MPRGVAETERKATPNTFKYAMRRLVQRRVGSHDGPRHQAPYLLTTVFFREFGVFRGPKFAVNQPTEFTEFTEIF